jgi:polyhydroxyalkanoate synthase
VKWVAAVVWLGAAGRVVWAAIPRDTDKRRVRAGPLRRLVRAGRTAIVRILLWLVGWPHLIDNAFFGARRPHVDATPSEVVWQAGKARLLRYDGVRSGEPVLLVHSMVSKPWILDLTPTRSLVRALVDTGFDVYLLDWGDPGRTEAALGLREHAALLRSAESAVLHMSGAGRLHRIGYCFGATLCLFDMTQAGTSPPAHVASNVLIAPVADFAVPGGFQLLLGRSTLPPVLGLDSGGCVPAGAIREAFHGLRPQALKTMWLRVRHGGRDPEYRDFYAAMAKWAWHHRRLPGALFFDMIDLYRTNWLLAALADARGDRRAGPHRAQRGVARADDGARPAGRRAQRDRRARVDDRGLGRPHSGVAWHRRISRRSVTARAQRASRREQIGRPIGRTIGT